MNNTINNSDSLADIVGINAIIEPSITSSPFMVIFLTIAISIGVSYFYYQFMHGFKGKLRHIKFQLKYDHLSPRDAAHKIATLTINKPLSVAHNDLLKQFRFASTMPSKQQMIEFIDHVE